MADRSRGRPKISLFNSGYTEVYEDRGLITGPVIPKTQKMVRDASLLNTHHYYVRVKGKWINPDMQWYHLQLSVVAIKKGAFDYGMRHIYIYIYIYIYTSAQQYFSDTLKKVLQGGH